MASLRESAGISLGELARLAGAALDGDASVVVRAVGTLEHAQSDEIAFLANPRYRRKLATTSAGAVILAPDAMRFTSLPKLVSDNPYATYARVAAMLHPQPAVSPGVDATARIDPSARVARTACIGAYAVIGANATIGERSVVGAHCVIGDATNVGDDAVLDARVTLYPRCIVGARTL
ncbi:MAG TPA: LpxD N-terminal domain-containing protein, partial [Casimicrobiaceae bacterium]|nr:LpxD N-terminal domain-containing protein [Casimicrobiaceae bacterium]